MKFVLTITLGNDAMETSHDIAAALKRLAKAFETYPACKPQDDNSGRIFDENGNRVGGWHVET